MTKRRLATIIGSGLILAGIVVGFFMYGRERVAKAPETNDAYVEQMATNTSLVVPEVLGVANNSLGNKELEGSANNPAILSSADIIAQVASRLESLRGDLVRLQEKESLSDRAVLGPELDRIKNKLLDLQGGGLTTENAQSLAKNTIDEAGVALGKLVMSNAQDAARRADLMITITAIGERLILLGKTALAYQEALKIAPENLGVNPISVSYN